MGKKVLFVSKYCGACPVVKRKLKEAGVRFREVSVDNKRGDALADRHRVKVLPSMVIDGKLVENVDKWFE